MLYIIFALIVLLSAACVLLLHFVRPKFLHKIIGHHFERKTILMLAGPLIVLSVSGIVFSRWLDSREVPTKPSVSIPAGTDRPAPKVAATVQLPGYEIVRQSASPATGARIEVYVSEVDKTKLDNLNKSLIAKSINDQVKTVSIHYFDSKAVAQVYFSKISDPALTVESKKSLVSHYIAASSNTAPFNNQVVFLHDKQDVAKKLLSNTSSPEKKQ